VWDYRHLLVQLTKRDLKARYKKSLLGILWSLLHPFLMMMVLAVVFSYVGRFNQGIEHYSAFILCGYLPWLYTATSLATSVRSVVDAGNLLHKVAFPREVLPLAVVLSNLVNFLVALIPFFIYLSVLGIRPGPLIVALPVVLLVHTMLLAGLAMAISAANVYARDVGVILEVALFAWFYLCPVFYPSSLVVEQTPPVFAQVYFANPMASLMVLYRTVLMNRSTPMLDMRLWGSAAVATSLVILVGGWLFFAWRQKSFVEEL
jgi:ABC-type polysaccharide/polyol phosphate export permease